MKSGLVLMTALPPTEGHKFLIDFAKSFMDTIDTGFLCVLINGRSFEPLLSFDRTRALFMSTKDDTNFLSNEICITYYDDDNAPQKPSSENDPDFWNYWKNLINMKFPKIKFDYVFASETYGIKLAETLGSTFIPCDINREVMNVSGTMVRNDPLRYFDKMLPVIQSKYQKVVTMFGPESVGKSTMTKMVFLGDPDVKVTRLPEWARGYLEAGGPEITDEKMLNIVYGQFALQRTAYFEIKKTSFILQDTDLLSTIGYYKLWSGNHPLECEHLFRLTKSDLYILMNDKIPFQSDPLRYGGDKRESDNGFWKELLQEYKCEYYEVKNTKMMSQTYEIEEVCRDLFYKTCKLSEFVRE